MKLTEMKSFITQIINEVKENNALPKSGGKLVHLKKELASLKQMQESVNQLSMNESSAEPMVAEYSHMQKYVNELEKIKAASAKLSEMLGNQVTEVEGRITNETLKIKEMIGLIEPAAKKAEKKGEKKAPKKSDDKKQPIKSEPKETESKKNIN